MTHAIEVLNQRLDALDKLRGTGAWDSHQDNLWHSLYKRLEILKKEYYQSKTLARRVSL